MTGRIKVGVAGAGVFGGHHAAKIAANPQATLTSVYDIDPLRARTLAERHKAKAYDDYTAFLAAIDAVIVTTPATTHFNLAYLALDKGRHVLIEKPITQLTNEADALVDVAQKRDITLQVGHQERYVAAAAGLFERALRPVKIDCVRTTLESDRCKDVSVVMDLMIHDIDLVRHLAMADIESVIARGSVDEVIADLALTNGSSVSLKASRSATTPERRMTLIYEDGITEFDFIKRDVSDTTPHKIQIDLDTQNGPLVFRDPLAFGTDIFLSAITHQSPPVVTGKDGRNALAWALEIEMAAGIHAADHETVERQRA